MAALIPLGAYAPAVADARVPAAPGAGGPEIVGVRVGLDGRYKPGVWTPVEVQLRNVGGLRGGRISVTVPDGDAVPSRVCAPLPCPDADDASERTAAGADTPVLLYTRFGRVKSELAVELRIGGDLVDRRVFSPGTDAGYRPAVLSEQELVVVVARDSVGVEEAVRRLQQAPEERTVVVRLEDLRQLPDHWYGYEGASAVVFSTSDPTIYAGLTPESPKSAALDEWIHNGGRLVLCVGEHARDVLGPGSALDLFAPGRLEKTPGSGQKAAAEADFTVSTLTGAFESYSGSSVPVRFLKGGIPVPYLVDVKGTIEARADRLPLVVRTARGFGQVIYVAADLDRPPFTQWEDRGRLVGMLLDYPASPIDEDDESTAIMHYGFADLAGQLRSALDRFPSVWLVPFWFVVGLILVYIVAIGPGDYFLLRKVVGRMRFTWITFPLIVVAFSVAAYVLAHRFKGDQLRVNQLDLVDVAVDVDRQTCRVRGTAWANVFSPRTERYDFSFRARLPDGRPAPEAKMLTVWLGLSGDALGGMNPRTTEPAIWRHHYDVSDRLDALSNVPIQIWSTKSLTGRWTAETDVGLEGRLAEEDGVPAGTITNALSFPLSDCLLAYGKYAYELGSVEPGASVRVGPNLRRRELKSLLTDRQNVFDKEKKDYRFQATPYDQDSVDVAYILRAMMFFKEAGGRRYTQLSNRYQGFVDFSDLLKTKHAVLVGRAESDSPQALHHGAELWCNGRPVPESQVRHTTVYRFVLPVQRPPELLAGGE